SGGLARAHRTPRRRLSRSRGAVQPRSRDGRSPLVAQEVLMASSALPHYTVPSMTPDQGAKVSAILQDRLHALNDLQLTLKHIHWNVVGPNSIAVHEMIDTQVDAVRAMVDQIAERIATLGLAPVGTPGALVEGRSWDDYAIARAGVQEHLQALDEVY